MKSKSLTWQQQGAVNRVSHALERGQIVLGSTDTVLGLLVSACPSGREQLDHIKGRSDKPYLILVGSLHMARKFGCLKIGTLAYRIAKKCWPGPLTLLVKANREVPPFLKSPDGLIAIRVADHLRLKQVTRRIGPLFSTSANKTGVPVPDSIAQVDPAIIKACKLIVLDEVEKKKQEASTIVDVSGDQVRLVRAGAYPFESVVE